jgi:dihydroorotase
MDETSIKEQLRLAAEQRGLSKALKLFPDGVKAASERGMKALGTPTQGISPIASPASIFNPVRFEQKT